MRIRNFTIKNFKGITETTIDIASEAPGNVITLVGLNESGKTTILEALSYFVSGDEDTVKLVGTVQPRSSMQDIIPKSKKAAFNDSVTITATVEIEDEDIKNIAESLQKGHDHVIDVASLPPTFTVEKSFQFEDSNLKKTMNYWMIAFKAKKIGANEAADFTGYAGEEKEKKTLWLDAMSKLGEALPKVVYFPTFLFDFPNKIYLETAHLKSEKEINEYYHDVMQDVLNSQGENLTLKKHIVERVQRLRGEHTNIATFMSFLFGKDERKQIDAVCQKLASEITRVVFTAWGQVLGRSVTNKRVEVNWLLDGDRNNAIYLELSIIEGGSSFSLSERSLGFRWFFSFLLFTQFRKNRKNRGSTLFIFDEPASNLHSKAQMRLLESFDKISDERTKIIYSTHSHYMINPLWLERAYIVQNKALDVDSETQEEEYDARKADIIATKYKTFVGSYPSRSSYFQPIIDALEVPYSPLVGASKAVIVEGKNDFYSFSYLRGQLSASKTPAIFPSTGAGSAGTLISLFRGWGVSFKVLLDDDPAGRRARKAYKDDFRLLDDEIATLADISPDLSGRSLESIYQDDLRDAIRTKYGIATVKKDHYALYFQYLLAEKQQASFPHTEEKFRPFIAWLDSF